MILPWLTGGIAALDLFIKDEIEREGEEEFPRDECHIFLSDGQ